MLCFLGYDELTLFVRFVHVIYWCYFLSWMLYFIVLHALRSLCLLSSKENCMYDNGFNYANFFTVVKVRGKKFNVLSQLTIKHFHASWIRLSHIREKADKKIYYQAHLLEKTQEKTQPHIDWSRTRWKSTHLLCIWFQVIFSIAMLEYVLIQNEW